MPPERDLRIYIASGRADAGGLVSLLERRAMLRTSSSPLACVDPPLMPHAIAPMHREPRVREALRQFGCSDDIVEQLDGMLGSRS